MGQITCKKCGHYWAYGPDSTSYTLLHCPSCETQVIPNIGVGISLEESLSLVRDVYGREAFESSEIVKKVITAISLESVRQNKLINAFYQCGGYKRLKLIDVQDVASRDMAIQLIVQQLTQDYIYAYDVAQGICDAFWFVIKGEQIDRSQEIETKTNYQNAVSELNEITAHVYSSTLELESMLERLSKLLEAFWSIVQYSDSRDRIKECIQLREKLEKEHQSLRAREVENSRRKAKKKRIIRAASLAFLFCLVCCVGFVAFDQFIIPQKAYNTAKAFEENGKYAEAAIQYAEAGNYKDSNTRSVSMWEREIKNCYLSAGGFHTVGIDVNGRILTAGAIVYCPDSDSAWKDIKALAAGGTYTMGLKSDGSVVYAGANQYGTIESKEWTEIVSISGGGSHCLGLRMDGTVVAAGHEDHIGNISDWQEIKSIAAGGGHSVGLRTDGTVLATGMNYDEQCNTASWNNIIAIAAGASHTVGICENGTVVATGDNRYGQCDTYSWTDIVAVAAGDTMTIGLKADGTVVASGDNEYGQCDVHSWRNIVHISACGNNVVGLSEDGTVYATGDNEFGACDVVHFTNIMC